MKKFVTVTAIILASLPAIAQSANVNIKQDMINACVNQVVEKNITDKNSAQKLCTCQVTVQGKMTMEQSWEIDSWAKSRKKLENLPTYKNMVKNLQACGNGIKFNQKK